MFIGTRVRWERERLPDAFGVITDAKFENGRYLYTVRDEYGNLHGFLDGTLFEANI